MLIDTDCPMVGALTRAVTHLWAVDLWSFFPMSLLVPLHPLSLLLRLWLSHT